MDYNQRHQKYMSKLQEIEDRLQGMTTSKEKSKSRTRKAGKSKPKRTD